VDFLGLLETFVDSNAVSRLSYGMFPSEDICHYVSKSSKKGPQV